MPGHKHAASMMLYAQDAAETDRPWVRWEHLVEGYCFTRCSCHPGWALDVQYRRKPRTIRIGEYDVPEPLREAPELGVRCWSPTVMPHCLGSTFQWGGAPSHIEMLHAGIVHPTREAAELHAKALISLSAKP